jgi:23S rRNA pseudouridine1911/1915/1917 synthase
MAASGLTRQALHAAVLGFVHPITGEALRFETPLPPDMAALETELGRNLAG